MGVEVEECVEGEEGGGGVGGAATKACAGGDAFFDGDVAREGFANVLFEKLVSTKGKVRLRGPVDGCGAGGIMCP